MREKTLCVVIITSLLVFLLCYMGPRVDLHNLFGDYHSPGGVVTGPTTYVGQGTLPQEQGGTVPLSATFNRMEGMENGDLDESLWKDSDTTAEYYKTFDSQRLKNLMPNSWQAKNDDASEDPSDEFSRFTIKPGMMRKAEETRGIMRLSEPSRSSSSRIIGLSDPVRNAVTPLNPRPIGSHVVTFQDSSIRQDLIAEITGKPPRETAC